MIPDPKMTNPHDVEKALQAYGYSSKQGAGSTWVWILSFFLFLAVCGAVSLGILWSNEKSRFLQQEIAFKKLSRNLSEMETRHSELSSLLTEKQSEIERIREEWSQQVAAMEKDHKEQLQRSFAQMNEIIYDAKKTLTYINDIETRLRQGQKMDQAEASKLSGIINGLTLLHEQYKKPMAEFRELDRYFQRQLSSLPRETGSGAPRAVAVPASAAAFNRPDPSETTNPLKKFFNNRQYRAEREAYLQEKGRAEGVAAGQAAGRQEGRREAYANAQQVVKEAYGRAQKQMEAIDVDKSNYLAQLDHLIDSNNASVADVEEFFKTSKEILKIHDEIMSMEPTKSSTVRP